MSSQTSDFSVESDFSEDSDASESSEVSENSDFSEVPDFSGDSVHPVNCALAFFRGGQIAENLSEWRKVTKDRWVLESVKGVKIPFEELLCQDKEPIPYRLSKVEIEFVDKELHVLLNKQIVERVEDEPGQVVSNIFLRPKKDGSFRIILDLTWVNLHVQYEHFKMHSIATATEMMRPDCWLASIDLKDAYYSVPVCLPDRKFLRFRWGGELFQFRVLPNGLACAPRFFTKILTPVFAKLREKGRECFPYIDDSFIVADSWEKCQATVEDLKDLLERLGFVVHPQKSELVPARELIFLGFRLDSREMRIFLTKEKEEKFLRAAGDLLNKGYPSIREVAGLVGLMVAFSQAVTYASSYQKQLEMDKILELGRNLGNYNRKMVVSELARQDIAWWVRNIKKSGRKIKPANIACVLHADASNQGWGAHVGELATGGRWSEPEAGDHINVLELRAILLGLRSLCGEHGSAHIRVMSDNTTAIAYVKHKGGVRSPECNRVAKEIWGWAEERQIWLSIAHIPGVENVLADEKSRKFADNLEWSLRE